MVLPPGAFLTFGLLLGLANWISTRRAGKEEA
jgi:Na+-translocating ferredoxin:NAD+ oxidoreductase RnfE subunit